MGNQKALVSTTSCLSLPQAIWSQNTGVRDLGPRPGTCHLLMDTLKFVKHFFCIRRCDRVPLLQFGLFFCFFVFFYLWLCWVFVSVRGLSLVVASGGHSSSRCAGLSLSRPLLLQSTGSRRAGSVVVAPGLSCSAACGIFPDQGSNPCPLHWQVDSQPLRHQGSPLSVCLYGPLCQLIFQILNRPCISGGNIHLVMRYYSFYMLRDLSS